MPGGVEAPRRVAVRRRRRSRRRCRPAPPPRPSPRRRRPAAISPGKPDARADLVRDADADEEFARAGARHRAGAIVGIGARADQRRIADPAPALAGDARRSRSRRRHGRARRSATAPTVPYFMSTSNAPPLGLQFVELAAAFGRSRTSPASACSSPCSRAERVGALAGRAGRARLSLHHRAGERDRVARRGHARDRTRRARSRPSMIAASSSIAPS